MCSSDLGVALGLLLEGRARLAGVVALSGDDAGARLGAVAAVAEALLCLGVALGERSPGRHTAVDRAMVTVAVLNRPEDRARLATVGNVGEDFAGPPLGGLDAGGRFWKARVRALTPGMPVADLAVNRAAVGVTVGGVLGGTADRAAVGGMNDDLASLPLVADAVDAANERPRQCADRKSVV